MKSASFNERVGIVSEIREAASRRSPRCCLGKSSLCETRPASHACQTNRAPHCGHIPPAREAETVERDCTSEPHPVGQHGKRYVDDSFRPLWNHLRPSGHGSAGRTARHSCCRQSERVKTISTTLTRTGR